MNEKNKIEKIHIVNSLNCATLNLLSAKKIEVEATFTIGLPYFTIVGLANSDIQESKDRVKSALLTNNFIFPSRKITINLSPSDIRKNGTHFDLGIAVLIAMNEEKIDEDIYIFGELGLDGKVKSNSNIFPIILSLKEQNLIKQAIVPKDIIKFLSKIQGVSFIPVETLEETINIFKNKNFKSTTEIFDYDALVLKINNENYFFNDEIEDDFKDIKGQKIAKRAALISASGMHNFIMEGSPGCGKTMIAKRLRDILPPLTEKEILSISKQESLTGENPKFRIKRPFRSPHHTATTASIFGGGSFNASIGEISLAHNGVLFFDELPHFPKNILDALREPLQDKKVNISRVNAKIEYSADIMFIGAMNPCPCGNLFSKNSNCRCNELEIKRYKNRLSEPLLDRIDIFIRMQEIDLNLDYGDISSKEMQEKVKKCFYMKSNRKQKALNGKIEDKDIDKFIILEKDVENILFQAVSKFKLSYRGVNSIKKVSRTIADLSESKKITKKHILEAISYRNRSSL